MRLCGSVARTHNELEITEEESHTLAQTKSNTTNQTKHRDIRGSATCLRPRGEDGEISLIQGEYKGLQSHKTLKLTLNQRSHLAHNISLSQCSKDPSISDKKTLTNRFPIYIKTKTQSKCKHETWLCKTPVVSRLNSHHKSTWQREKQQLEITS